MTESVVRAVERHVPDWMATDPTGGDPSMGGPVVIWVCKTCGTQKGFPANHPAESYQ